MVQQVYQEGRRAGERKVVQGKARPDQLKADYRNLEKRAAGQLELTLKATGLKKAKSTRLGGPPSEQENIGAAEINRDLSAVGGGLGFGDDRGRRSEGRKLY